MSTKSLSQILAALVAVFWIAAAGQSPARAAGETRTLSLYFTHTKESLTVTYKKNGRYIPSAMQQLNHFLRDWRKKEAIRMDPRTIDLMWELHADLGSQKPVHIISGYRSPKTNAMLRRIGRKVASRSRHMTGQAIDLYFPDVPIARLRGSALVRKIGGVGYYPRSGKYGFVHIDSGNVRHWPRVSKTRMAKIYREYRGTVGARLRRNGQQPVMVASAPAAPSGPTAITPKGLASASLAAAAVPAPRPRPMEVVMAAAALADDLRIEPASAPVPQQNFAAKPSIIRDDAMTMTATLSDLIKRTLSPKSGPETNASAKSGLAADIRSGNVTTTPLIRPLLTASQDDADGTSWWDSLFASGDSAMRRDGAPQPFSDQAIAISSMSKSDEAALQRMIASLSSQRIISTVSEPDRSAKGDRLVVNRSGKGDLVAPAAMPVLRRQSLSDMTGLTRKVARSDAAILRQGVRPLSFE